MYKTLGVSASEMTYILYCVGWGVKLTQLTHDICVGRYIIRLILNVNFITPFQCMVAGMRCMHA